MAQIGRSQLTGVAGVHYVASYLAYLEFHAVPTTRNVSGPDLLVSNPSGSKALSLQVKSPATIRQTELCVLVHASRATEGFGTQDLKDAKALLEELA